MLIYGVCLVLILLVYKGEIIMGITKIIYNNDTLMDNTTVSVLPTAMLINVTALQNNGIDISGTISNQTADNIIMNSTNINIASGYYSSNINK